MCAEPIPQSADRIPHAGVIYSVVHKGREESPDHVLSGTGGLVDEYAVYTTCRPFLISSRSACLFFDCAFHSHFFLYPSYPVPPQDAELSGHSQAELR